MFRSREDKGALGKLVEAIKTNYNDRYEEVSSLSIVFFGYTWLCSDVMNFFTWIHCVEQNELFNPEQQPLKT